MSKIASIASTIAGFAPAAGIDCQIKARASVIVNFGKFGIGRGLVADIISPTVVSQIETIVDNLGKLSPEDKASVLEELKAIDAAAEAKILGKMVEVAPSVDNLEDVINKACFGKTAAEMAAEVGEDAEDYTAVDDDEPTDDEPTDDEPAQVEPRDVMDMIRRILSDTPAESAEEQRGAYNKLRRALNM